MSWVVSKSTPGTPGEKQRLGGKLTLVRDTGPNKQGKRMWECLCECGGTAVVKLGHFRALHIRSCGCLVKASRPSYCRVKGRTYDVRKGSSLEAALRIHAKRRARKNGIPFSLEIDDIVIPKVCPLLGITLACGKGQVVPSSPSLDRIDSTKGYTKDNVWVISHRANTIKNNATVEEFTMIAEGLLRKLAQGAPGTENTVCESIVA